MARSSNLKGGRDNKGDSENYHFKVENSEVAYEGSFLSLRDLGNATAANQGYIGAYTGAAGEVLVGEGLPLRDPIAPATDGDYTFDGSVTGDTSASPPPAIAAILKPIVYVKIAVTGTSSIADVGRLVYLSDDDTLTLTPQTRVDPIGQVIRWHTSTTCDVFKWGFGQRGSMAHIQRLWVSTEPKTVTGTSGDLVTGFPMPFHGLILTVGYVVTTAVTGSAYDTVINAELGGTNITGGTLALADGAAGSYAVGSSFATAAHYFSRGTLLDLEISGTVATDAGAVSLFVDVIQLPGA